MEKKNRRSLMQPSNLLTRTAVKKAGGVKELAALLGITIQSVYAWGDRVPVKRAKQLEALWTQRKDGE